jgi:hypothetical protein
MPFISASELDWPEIVLLNDALLFFFAPVLTGAVLPSCIGSAFTKGVVVVVCPCMFFITGALATSAASAFSFALQLLFREFNPMVAGPGVRTLRAVV